MKFSKYLLVSIFIFSSFTTLWAVGNKEAPSVESKTGETYISPNGDGVQDSGDIAFNVKLFVKSDGGYIPEYGYVILDSSGKEIRKKVENDENDISKFLAFFRRYEEFNLSRKIFWDGKDNDGKIVPDGAYTVKVWAVDIDDNRTEVEAGTFYVDTAAPSIKIAKPENNVFSPNSDGNLDLFVINQEASKEKLWKAFIKDADGQVVRTFRTIEDAPSKIEWDGTDDRAMKVPDGVYSYEIQSTDEAGNKSGLIKLENIIKDTTPTEIAAVYYDNGFSPNGDGNNDTLEIKLFHEYEKNYKMWQWSMTDSETGEVVLEVTGDNELPQSIILEGIYKNGQVLKEGLYNFEYFVEYRHGNRPVVKDSFYVDYTAPELAVTTAADPFIKTSKGDAEGEVFITVNAADNIDIKQWELEIYDKEGNVIRTYSGQGDPSKQISWDATTEEGSNLPADNIENYEMKLVVRDFGGNESVYQQPVNLELLVVEKEGKLYLMVPNIIFEMYKYELDSRGDEQYSKNLASLDRVVEIYNKYSDIGFKLELEGHALNIYEPGTAKWDEEELILVPLTENRAGVVKGYLVENGIPKEVIITTAYGGRFPIVSTTDREIWWKNRRVEFVMIKNPSEEEQNKDLLEGYSINDPDYKGEQLKPESSSTDDDQPADDAADTNID